MAAILQTLCNDGSCAPRPTENTFAGHLSMGKAWEKTKCLHPVHLTLTAK